jgi:hypothetical protein
MVIELGIPVAMFVLMILGARRKNLAIIFGAFAVGVGWAALMFFVRDWAVASADGVVMLAALAASLILHQRLQPPELPGERRLIPSMRRDGLWAQLSPVVAPLFVAVMSVWQVVRNPHNRGLRAIDVLMLLAAGVCLYIAGVALAALFRKRRTQKAIT